MAVSNVPGGEVVKQNFESVTRSERIPYPAHEVKMSRDYKERQKHFYSMLFNCERVSDREGNKTYS